MKKLLSVALILVLAVSMFAGCAAKTETPAETPAATTEAAVTPEPAPVPVKVGLLLSGPVNDGGWNATAYNGLKAIEKDFGAEISYQESVKASDYEEVFRTYATNGFNVIFGHGYEFGDAALKVAAEFPEVKFIVTSTNINNGTNVASLKCSNLMQGFLSGVAAGLVTKTNVVGAVGGMEIPPIFDALRGFEAGAKYVNPKITVLTAMTGNFEDATACKEAALSMIEKKADIVMQDADQAGMGVFEAAQDKKILAIGSIGDQTSIAPTVVLTSGIADYVIGFDYVFKLIQDGKFEAKFYDLGMKEGTVFLANNPALESNFSDAAKAKIKEISDGIIAGTFDVYAESDKILGPVK
ncbi:MAG: BMP family protein [Clostridia bacterium]